MKLQASRTDGSGILTTILTTILMLKNANQKVA